MCSDTGSPVLPVTALCASHSSAGLGKHTASTFPGCRNTRGSQEMGVVALGSKRKEMLPQEAIDMCCTMSYSFGFLVF